MARGWGRSEEDLEAEKEQARAERGIASKKLSPQEAERQVARRGLELSLARVKDQLTKTSNPDRRRALEAARSEILERLDALEP